MSEYYEKQTEVVKVRIDKYNKLCEEGKDPYKENKYDFDAYCKDINEKFEEYEE